MPSINATAFFGGISRTCKFARVVTWQNGPHSFSIRSARPANCQCFRIPFGIRKPAHVGILRRRDIEQAVIAPAEIVRRVRRRIVERLLLQPRIGIERMLLALELFLVDELLAGGCDLVLRLDVRGLRPARLGIRLAGAAAEAAPYPADLQAGGKAFEVALLLVGKVDCERFDLHGARRSSCGHEGWHQRNWGNRV